MALPAALNGIFKQRNKTYKMVLILSILDEMDKQGNAPYLKVKDRFLSFYQQRSKQGKTVEKPPENLSSWEQMTIGKLSATIYTPEKALSNILVKENDVIGFRTEIWNLLGHDEIEELRDYANREIEYFYKEQKDDFQKNQQPRTHNGEETVIKVIDHIKSYILSRGFSYSHKLIENFYLSIKSKPFVILAGISGTGKTKLVKMFAEALSATRENGQFTLIPVRPDWSDPSDLIGYKDLSGSFQPGALTNVLLEASKPSNSAKPYFICLDEMNLARVEHYFSDLLSLMETQEWVEDEDGEKCIVTSHVISTVALNDQDQLTYGNLCIPDNVYIIGTVNMDETTHPFSKKVLDRANTIEFNYIDLDNFAELENLESERPDPLNYVHQSFLRSDYLTLQDALEYKELIKETTAKLTRVNQILELIHAHVGFRIRDAISFYMIYNHRFNLLNEDAAFDIQLCQKILPRIQGSSSTVQKTLVHLLDFTMNKEFALGAKETLKTNDLFDERSLLSRIILGEAKELLDDAPYPESAKKIAYMLRRLEEDGFTSFWLS